MARKLLGRGGMPFWRARALEGRGPSRPPLGIRASGLIRTEEQGPRCARLALPVEWTLRPVTPGRCSRTMADVRIRIRKDGPIVIEAEGLELVDHEKRPFGLGGRTNIALCRCGASANKPFCDGAHNKAGFVSECVAFELPTPQPKA